MEEVIFGREGADGDHRSSIDDDQGCCRLNRNQDSASIEAYDICQNLFLEGSDSCSDCLLCDIVDFESRWLILNGKVDVGYSDIVDLPISRVNGHTVEKDWARSHIYFGNREFVDDECKVTLFQQERIR